MLFLVNDVWFLPFLWDNSLYCPFSLFIILHKQNIEEVDTEKKSSLPPSDVVVHKEEDKGDEGDAVEGTIPEENDRMS